MPPRIPFALFRPLLQLHPTVSRVLPTLRYRTPSIRAYNASRVTVEPPPPQPTPDEMAAMLEETLQNTRNANAKLNVVLLLMLMPMLVTGLGMSWLALLGAPGAYYYEYRSGGPPGDKPAGEGSTSWRSRDRGNEEKRSNGAWGEAA